MTRRTPITPTPEQHAAMQRAKKMPRSMYAYFPFSPKYELHTGPEKIVPRRGRLVPR